MSNISETLTERGLRYGNFADHAILSQSLQRLLLSHMNKDNPKQLAPFMIEALVMICHKLARIANGDPKYIDTWRDLSGYAQLVVDSLQSTEGATDAIVSTLQYKDGNWSTTNS